MLDILTDIAAKYQQLTKEGDSFRANQLLIEVAGLRQLKSAAALFGDFGNSSNILRY